MIAEMLDRFQIVAKLDLFPEQLSGGQQQLVGVVRALIGKPKLLLADEPTGNLHSGQGEEVMDILKQLHESGMTIVQVTHNEKFAEYGTRVINLEDGRIVTDIHPTRIQSLLRKASLQDRLVLLPKVAIAPFLKKLHFFWDQDLNCFPQFLFNSRLSKLTFDKIVLKYSNMLIIVKE